MKFLEMFKSSLNEFKSLRSLTAMGLLLAVRLLLSTFVSVPIGDTLKIGMSFVATAVMGMLFGPIGGGIVSAVGDILQFAVKPSGVFFPGYTLTAFLGGFIYGLFLYKFDFKNKPQFILRVIAAKASINIFVNVILGTLWLKILYNKAFIALLPVRLIKNLTLLPFEIVILVVILPAIYFGLKRARVGHLVA